MLKPTKTVLAISALAVVLTAVSAVAEYSAQAGASPSKAVISKVNGN